MDYERELENQDTELIDEVCEICNGSGGYDASTDIEAYDDWEECPGCGGKGFIMVEVTI